MTHDVAIPDHVPHPVVVDFDIFNPPDLKKGVHEAWLALHRSNGSDVLWTPRNGGHWILNNGALVPQFYADFEHFSSRNEFLPRSTANSIPASLDPPEHTKFRRIINTILSPKIVGSMNAEIQSRTIELVEGLAPKNKCDFVGDFALKLPLELFMNWANLPTEDIPKLRYFVERTMRPSDGVTALEAMDALMSYLDPYLHARRAEPGRDLLSLAVTGELDARKITHDEARRMCGQFLIAGLDTVAAMLSFIFLYMARHSEIRARLREDEDLLSGAVEEFLRRFPIVSPVREVVTDFPCDGVTLRRGDLIVIPTLLHGLDPQIFPDPESVDPQRKPQTTSTFGQGPHRCPGSMLARTELRTVLREWLRRIPDFTVEDESAIVFRAGIVGSIAHLPLRWS
jgi:cytochrome P450